MASLTKRGKVWSLRWREGGKAHRQSYGTKREALEAQAKLETRTAATKPARGRLIIPLTELVERYFNQRPSDYNDRDRRIIALALANHTHWTRAADPHRDELLALPVGQYRLIRSILRYAAAIGQSVDPALMHLRRPGTGRKPQPALLTTDQVNAALNRAMAWGECSHLAVHLVATYGHRPASLIKLRINSLQGDQLTLDVKGGDTHAHPILPTTKTLWTAAAGTRPTNAKILLHSQGAPWANGCSLANWYYQHVGPHAHPHDPGIYALKRYAISSMLAAGLDAKTVASITGHRTPSLLLNTYARTNETRQRQALNTLAHLAANV
jgi:integrase